MPNLIRHFLLGLAGIVSATLAGCDLRYALFGFPTPVYEVRQAGQPIELEFREGPGGLVLIKGTVNGLAPAEFILDTGAPVTVLIDGPQSSALRLDSSKARRLGDADDPAAPIGTITPGFALDFGPVALSDLTAVVLPFDRMPCRERFAAIGFQGVIGADLFRRFIVQIDHAAKRVRLFEPGAWAAPGGAASLPITFKAGHPYVDGVLERDGKPVPVHLHVDTGQTAPVHFFVSGRSEIPMPAGGEATTACLASGTVEMRKGPPAALALGGLRVEAPATYSRPRGRGDQRVDGAVGMGLLKQFVIFVDYPHQRFHLRGR